MQPYTELVSVKYFRHLLVAQHGLAHWQEVGQDKSWPVDMYWDYYDLLERANKIQITALFVDGLPVGYFVSIISTSMHYQTHTVAASDVFYIAPDFRQYAIRLFRAAEANAKSIGAEKLYLSFKVYKDITPITKRLGYKAIETVVVKSLE